MISTMIVIASATAMWKMMGSAVPWWRTGQVTLHATAAATKKEINVIATSRQWPESMLARARRN